jgi:hypothetical protein
MAVRVTLTLPFSPAEPPAERDFYTRKLFPDAYGNFTGRFPRRNRRFSSGIG